MEILYLPRFARDYKKNTDAHKGSCGKEGKNIQKESF